MREDFPEGPVWSFQGCFFIRLEAFFISVLEKAGSSYHIPRLIDINEAIRIKKPGEIATCLGSGYSER